MKHRFNIPKCGRLPGRFARPALLWSTLAAGAAPALGWTNQLQDFVSVDGCPSRYVCSDPSHLDPDLFFGYGVYGGEPGPGAAPPIPTMISGTKSDPVHGGTASASAVADYGKLGVMASASSPDDLFRVGPFAYLDTANAHAHAEFDDNLTVTGTPGAVTLVLFTAVLSGYMLPNPSVGHVELTTYVDDPNRPLIRNSFPNSTTGAAFVTARAGSTLHVHVDLTASVGASCCGPHPYTALANFLNTGRLYADVQSSGFGLVSGSSHDYASALVVPEPAPWALMLAGAVALPMMVRRSRRQA